MKGCKLTPNNSASLLLSVLISRHPHLIRPNHPQGHASLCRKSWNEETRGRWIGRRIYHQTRHRDRWRRHCADRLFPHVHRRRRRCFRHPLRTWTEPWWRRRKTRRCSPLRGSTHPIGTPSSPWSWFPSATLNPSPMPNRSRHSRMGEVIRKDFDPPTCPLVNQM
jgi:hypothetical protein